MSSAPPVPLTPAANAPLLPGLDTLCEALLPLWARHIEATRVHSEAAVLALTARFAALCTHLETVMHAAHAAADASAQLGGLLTRAADAAAPARTTAPHPFDDFHDAAATLGTATAVLRSEGQAVQGALREAIVAFQFHDRASQILSHVVADLERLAARVTEARHCAAAGACPEPLDVAAWLAALQAAYTTAEQHDIHAGRPAQAPAAGSDITFF